MKRNIKIFSTAIKLLTVVIVLSLAGNCLAEEDMFADLYSTNLAGNDDNGDESLREAFDSLKGGSPAGALLLTENAKAWTTRWWMLDKAKTSIDTTYFIVEKDIFGMAFLGHLLVKAKSGCKVRFMIDTKGSLKLTTTGLGQDYLQTLVDKGDVEITIYAPAGKSLISQGIQTFQSAIGQRDASSAVAACNHDKILISDDKFCMTGGRNIANLYFAPSVDFPDVFRDTDVLFESKEVADDLRRAFSSEVTSRFNKKVKGEGLGFNIRRDIELTAAYIMMDEWLKGTPCTDEEITALLTNEDRQLQAAETLKQAVVKRLPELGFERTANKWDARNFMPWAMELVSYPRLKGAGSFDPESEIQSVDCAKIIDKGSAQNGLEDGIQMALVRLVGAAEKSIVIQNPYVVLTKMAVKAFADAGKRGVKITIVTNSPVSSDSKETQGFFLDKWPLYQAAIPNLEFKVLAGRRKLHAKAAVFDDVISFIGTYNLDYMSARVNSEIISISWSEGLAAQLTESIINDPSYAADLFEYKIKLNDDGSPVDSDPSTPEIDPVIEQGADDHVPPEIMEEYEKIRKRTRLMEKALPQLDPLY